MNTVNRVVIVIVLLMLMAILTAVFILPHVLLINIGEWLAGAGRYFNQIQPVWRLVGGLLLSLIFDLLILFLIFLEVRKPPKRFIRVQQVTGGLAAVSAESIVQQLVYNLDPLPNVIKVTPKVHAKKDKVQAIVDVDVEAGADVPALATKLMDVVKTVLSDSLGLQVYGQPEVRIKVAPAPTPVVKKSRPVAEPPAPSRPVAPVEMPQEPPSLPEKPQEWAGPPPLPTGEER
ncbi:MAG TPA: hypothetical protein PLJ78_15960 [Anaerolineae bacterium]|nr:hypothetical protein [Anaerolineae bacterium]HQK15429.1 hypothetical protein [Anaerolineae bacterium]